jgi:hypothetical protein
MAYDVEVAGFPYSVTILVIVNPGSVVSPTVFIAACGFSVVKVGAMLVDDVNVWVKNVERGVSLNSVTVA